MNDWPCCTGIVLQRACIPKVRNYRHTLGYHYTPTISIPGNGDRSPEHASLASRELATLDLLLDLLSLPLPFDQDGEELPQIEFRPQTLQEDYRCVLMTLPKHEITQALHARCA